MAQQGIEAAKVATTQTCAQERATLDQAIEAYTLLEGAPPTEAQLVPDYLVEQSRLYDLDPTGGLVPAPGSTCS